jgi:hypothetical protein
MVDARDAAAFCGIALSGTTQILTADLSQKSTAKIDRRSTAKRVTSRMQTET